LANLLNRESTLIKKKGNVNNVKMKLCPNWRSCALWLSLVWVLGLALFAPAQAPADSLLFTAPPQLTNGGYLLRFSGPPGRVLQVQASTDLTQWTSIATLTISTGQAEVLDRYAASLTHRFYRAVAPLSYRLTVIQPPPGYTGASAGALNSAGQVAGQLSGTSYDGFFWDAGQTVVLPPLPGFSGSLPLALSDTGLIVGVSGLQATLWTRNDDGSFAVTDLNSLLPPDFGFSLQQAEAISPDGRFIAARYPDPTTGIYASAILEIDSAGALVSATALELRSHVYALRVDNGILKITGSRTNGVVIQGHAFLWEGPASPFNFDSGQFFDLSPPGFGDSTAGRALNSKGQVAGGSGGSPSQGLFWDENRQMVNMFAGQTVSAGDVLGINDAGFVVGDTSPDLSYYQAFLWHRGAPFQTLISLKSPSDTSGVTVLNTGSAINNAGQILAHGQYQAGHGDVSVLMTPE
jgi:hypothetical protein